MEKRQRGYNSSSDLFLQKVRMMVGLAQWVLGGRDWQDAFSSHCVWCKRGRFILDVL